MAHFWNRTPNEDHQAELDELRWMEEARRKGERRRADDEADGFFEAEDGNDNSNEAIS